MAKYLQNQSGLLTYGSPIPEEVAIDCNATPLHPSCPPASMGIDVGAPDPTETALEAAVASVEQAAMEETQQEVQIEDIADIEQVLETAQEALETAEESLEADAATETEEPVADEEAVEEDVIEELVSEQGLEDINAKLELKKMDQAITRTVENVILLITMGAEPDKGGINQNNLVAMQKLFKNESVGRVLVSDYTTKADFVIPDLNKVLGPEKYKVLNEDIKQGLQNIIVGEEKYSSTEVKAEIFLDRLKEARNAFLNDFLQPEIKRIAKTLGLKKYPTAKFRDIDIRDKTQLMRVTTRLMELGIITPQQGIDMFHTGEFPKSEDIAPSQPEFVSQRKEGYYNPIVGGIPTISPPEPKDTTDSGPINATPKVAGRPEGTTGIPLAKAKVSVKNIRGIVSKIEELHASIESELKASLSLETLSDNQQEMVNKLCETVIVSSNLESWAEVASSCVKDFEAIASLSTLPEVLEAAAEFEIDDDYSAALLYHSSGLV